MTSLDKLLKNEKKLICFHKCDTKINNNFRGRS